MPRLASLVPIILVAAGAFLTLTIFRKRAVSPIVFGTVLTTLLVIYGSVVTMGVPILEQARPTAAVAEDLRSQLAEGDNVGLYRLERWRYSLRYYLERPVSRLQHPKDVHDFFRKSRGYVLMLDEDFARLRDQGVNLRCVSERPAVIGTTGRGLRRQKWGALVVATLDDTPRLTDTPRWRCMMQTNRTVDGRAVLSGGAAVDAAEREWQTGTWHEARVERPRVLFSARTRDPNSPLPRTAHRARAANLCHRHRNARLELRQEATVETPRIDVSLAGQSRSRSKRKPSTSRTKKAASTSWS